MDEINRPFTNIVVTHSRVFLAGFFLCRAFGHVLCFTKMITVKDVLMARRCSSEITIIKGSNIGVIPWLTKEGAGDEGDSTIKRLKSLLVAANFPETCEMVYVGLK